MRGSKIARSAAIIACRSAGEPPIGSEATVANLVFTSGSFSASLAARLSVATMSAGVPFGT